MARPHGSRRDRHADPAAAGAWHATGRSRRSGARRPCGAPRRAVAAGADGVRSGAPHAPCGTAMADRPYHTTAARQSMCPACHGHPSQEEPARPDAWATRQPGTAGAASPVVKGVAAPAPSRSGPGRTRSVPDRGSGLHAAAQATEAPAPDGAVGVQDRFCPTHPHSAAGSGHRTAASRRPRTPQRLAHPALSAGTIVDVAHAAGE